MDPEYPIDPIGVRHNVLPKHAQTMRYYFNGQWHFMLEDEADAIARSGRSVDEEGNVMFVQDYADPMCPNEWPKPTVPFIPLMEGRPGKSEPGMRPVHEVIYKPRRDRHWNTKARDGFFHFYLPMKNKPSCGARGAHSDVYSFHRFRHIMDHEKGCPKCKVNWLGEWARRKRIEDLQRNARHERSVKVKDSGSVKVKNWTKDERRRLKEFRSGGSGMSGHGKRVPERGSATDIKGLA